MIKQLNILILLFLSGCSVWDTPELMGTVSNDTYTYPGNLFSCPLPGPAQGFHNVTEINDVAEIIKRERRLEPNHPRANIEGPWVDKIIYPITYKPSTIIRMRDKDNKGTAIDISFRTLKSDDNRDPIYTSGYGGGNYGLLHEEVATDTFGTDENLKYGLALAQLPYWTKGVGYMGADLWLLHLQSDEPAPSIDTVVNIIKGNYHFTILMHSSSQPFLPDDLNFRDLEQVYNHLKGNPTILKTAKQNALNWLKHCQFNDKKEETPPSQALQ